MSEGLTDGVRGRETAIDSLLQDLSSSQEELEAQNEQLRMAQAAVEESRNRYFELFEVAPVAYLEVDDAGVVVDANRAAGQLFAMGSGELLGRPLGELWPAQYLALLASQREHAATYRRSEPSEAYVVNRDGQAVPVLVQTTLLPSRAPATHLMSLVDISRQKRTEVALAAVARELEDANQRLQDLAMRDALTGIQNRRGFERALAIEVERARRGGAPLCAVLIDFDDFKGINDTYGHAAGDLVLSTVARRLSEVLRPSDQLARIGGDEFLALLPETNFAQATVVAERLRLAGAQPVALPDGCARLTLSLAVAVVAHEAGSIEEILSATTSALKESKSRGKNRVSVAPTSGSGPRPVLPSTIHLTTMPDALRTVFSPLVELATERTLGYEVLVRGPEGPLHMPAELFRAAAAENDLLGIDLRCLGACLRAAAAIRPGLARHVNLYPKTLESAPWDRVRAMLTEAEGADLCIELSEHHMVGDPAELRARTHRLRDLGVRIAIDDVGFGRTSLESLIVLEPDVVKIDRAYISGVAGDVSKARMLRRLLQIAESIRAVTVAEGIETTEDLAVVRDLGVTYGQGYLWGTPRPRPVPTGATAVGVDAP